MTEIRARVETGMMGAAVGDVVTLDATPLVLAAVRDGRLTVLDQPAPELKGEALDQALRERGLSLSGTADEKRARLAEHPRTTEVPGLPAGGEAPGGTAIPDPATVVTPAGTPAGTP